MTPQIDPIWPWRLLTAGLSTAPPSVTAAVIGAGLLAFSFPILLVRYPTLSQRRRLYLGAGLVTAGLLGWIGFGHAWETSLEMTTGGAGVWLARLAGVALSLLFIAPMALAGLTAATYLAAANSSPRRTAVILTLRAAAFLLAAVAILRPYIAINREGAAGGDILLIALDASKSMTIQDELSQPRWGDGVACRATPSLPLSAFAESKTSRSRWFASRTRLSRFHWIIRGPQTERAPTSAECSNPCTSSTAAGACAAYWC